MASLELAKLPLHTHINNMWMCRLGATKMDSMLSCANSVIKCMLLPAVSCVKWLLTNFKSPIGNIRVTWMAFSKFGVCLNWHSLATIVGNSKTLMILMTGANDNGSL